jgi:cytochrome c oxidase cbb3-type subunit 3
MIKRSALIVVAVAVTAVAASLFAYRPSPDRQLAGDDVAYQANCAGCHGADGKGGAARGLADPVFLQIANEATLRRVTASGVPGTAMPAFAKSAGGTLTDAQIDAIVHGIRSRWTKVEGADGVIPPPYAVAAAGDPKRGQDAFGTFCSRCHGADGRGGQGSQGGGSIVDPSYLSLVSDQGLRTTVIAGRPDLAAPDWRGNVPGRPMSSDEISNVVAWLASMRSRD